MYLREFSSYIADFMDRARLWPASGKVVVAVSGGVDSMALLQVMAFLRDQGRVKEVRAVHINHGTRSDNDSDEKLVLEFSKKLRIDITIKRFDLLLSLSNFESFAREKRQKFFNEVLEDDEFLFQAHHIDDSFEWSLMQQFKSSSFKSQLGIPVKNERIVRPFLCVTKDQIIRFSVKNDIPWRDDSSNEDIHYERNYVRKVVIPKIKERFPKYLKNYVYRSNDFAYRHGVSRLAESRSWIQVEDRFGGIALVHPKFERQFEGADEEIIEIIMSISNTFRGSLRSQVQKMIQAVKKGKRGPLAFSGGVTGYMGQGVLYFLTSKQKSKLKSFDLSFEDNLQNLRIGQMVNLSFDELRTRFLMGEVSFCEFLISKKINLCDSLRKKSLFLPESSSKALEQNLWINDSAKLLYEWQKAGAKGHLELFLP